MSGFQDSISRIVITRFMRVIHSFYAWITRTNRRMNPLVLLIYLFSFATSAPAFAACSNNEDGNPGQEAEIEFFTATNKLMYCDGTDWILMTQYPCPSGIASCGGNPNERLVFSSGVGVAPAAFGGISGADALCQGWADGAGLHGTYIAWLADNTTDPATRFEKPTVPYVMVDGVKVADNWTDLTDGSIDAFFRVNPTGGGTSNTLVASNVRTDGTVQNTALTAHCNNFTSGADGAVMNVGRNDFTNSAWTVFQNRACGILRSIYCFEQQTGPAPTTCTNRGEFYYNTGSDVMQWCDSTYVRDMGPAASGSGGCTSPTGAEGAMAYVTDRYKFCDGNGWVDIGK